MEALRAQHSSAHSDPEHRLLLQQIEALEEEVRALIAERDEWENAVGGGAAGMQAEIDQMKRETSVLVDDIYILEGHLLTLAGGDRAALDAFQREHYGQLYVEGEGLAEIEGL